MTYSHGWRHRLHTAGFLHLSLTTQKVKHTSVTMRDQETISLQHEIHNVDQSQFIVLCWFVVWLDYEMSVFIRCLLLPKGMSNGEPQNVRLSSQIIYSKIPLSRQQNTMSGLKMISEEQAKMSEFQKHQYCCQKNQKRSKNDVRSTKNDLRRTNHDVTMSEVPKSCQKYKNNGWKLGRLEHNRWQ